MLTGFLLLLVVSVVVYGVFLIPKGGIPPQTPDHTWYRRPNFTKPRLYGAGAYSLNRPKYFSLHSLEQVLESLFQEAGIQTDLDNPPILAVGTGAMPKLEPTTDLRSTQEYPREWLHEHVKSPLQTERCLRALRETDADADFDGRKTVAYKSDVLKELTGTPLPKHSGPHTIKRR